MQICLSALHDKTSILICISAFKTGNLDGPSLIAGLDCGLDRWTGLLDWITGSNQTASKSNDACVAH